MRQRTRGNKDSEVAVAKPRSQQKQHAEKSLPHEGAAMRGLRGQDKLHKTSRNEIVMKKKPKKRDRQEHILSAINAHAAVEVSYLAEELGVSTQTVRRDLDELSVNGVINRTYGGAAVRGVGLEPTLMERSRMATSERSIIADLA